MDPELKSQTIQIVGPNCQSLILIGTQARSQYQIYPVIESCQTHHGFAHFYFPPNFTIIRKSSAQNVNKLMKSTSPGVDLINPLRSMPSFYALRPTFTPKKPSQKLGAERKMTLGKNFSLY